MLQSSITAKFLKKLWYLLTDSLFYKIILIFLSFIAESYKTSYLRKFLLSLGCLDRFADSSFFCKIYKSAKKVFYGLAMYISEAARRSFILKIYNKLCLGSLLFGKKELFALLISVMFLIPHSYWNNIYGLFISLILLVLYVFSISDPDKNINGNELIMKDKHIPFSFLLFGFSIFIAVLTSNDINDSLRVLFFFIASFIMCFSVSRRINTKEMLDCFMKFIYFTLILMSFVSIGQRILGVEADASLTDLTLNKDMPGRVFGTMDNPNNLAEYLTIFIPFGFAYSLNRKSADQKLLYLVFMIFPIASILMTYARSSWIALAIVAVVYIVLYNYKLLPAFFIAGVAMIPFIPQNIYNRILTIGNLKDSSSAYRIEIWSGCLEMLKKYWFTGVGLGPGAFGKIFPKYAFGETTVVMHSHMQFMEMLVEGGILCFIGYIAMAYGVIRAACVASARVTDGFKHYVVAAAASVSGITLIGMFEYCWFYPRVMFAFFISVGLCLAVSRMAENSSEGNND